VTERRWAGAGGPSNQPRHEARHAHHDRVQPSRHGHRRRGRHDRHGQSRLGAKGGARVRPVLEEDRRRRPQASEQASARAASRDLAEGGLSTDVAQLTENHDEQRHEVQRDSLDLQARSGSFHRAHAGRPGTEDEVRQGA